MPFLGPARQKVSHERKAKGDNKIIINDKISEDNKQRLFYCKWVPIQLCLLIKKQRHQTTRLLHYSIDQFQSVRAGPKEIALA